MIRPRLKKFLTTCFALLIFLFAGIGYFIYSELSDLEHIKAMVVEELERLTHRKVTIGGAQLDFTEGLTVNLQDVALRHPEQDQTEFSAKEFHVKMKLWPLLNKRVEIQKVIIKDSLIQVTRNKEGEYNFYDLQSLFSKSVEVKNQESQWFDLLRVSFSHSLEVRNGAVRFFDHVGTQDKPKEFFVKNVHLSFEKAFLTGAHKISFTGDLPQPGKGLAHWEVEGQLGSKGSLMNVDDLSFEGTTMLTGLELPFVLPHMPAQAVFLPRTSLVSLDTKFSAALAGGLKLDGKMKFQPMQRGAAISPPKARLDQGVVDFAFDVQENQVEFSRFNVRAGDFRFFSQGKVSAIKSGTPRLSLSVKSSAFLADESESYPPLKLLPPKVHELIHKVFVHGTLEAKHISFEGTWDQFKNITKPINLKLLDGELLLTQVNWSRPLPPFERVTGIMGMDKGDTVIDVHQARYAGLPVRKLKGRIISVAKDPQLDWWVESQLKLPDLQRALPSIMRNPSFEPILARYKNLQGDGLLTLKILGPLKKFYEIDFSGDLTFSKASFDRDDADLPVTRLKGEAHYHLPVVDPPPVKGKRRPWEVTFAKFEGLYGDEAFSKMSGSLASASGQPKLKYTGEILLDPVASSPRWVSNADLTEEARKFAERVEVVDGKILLTFNAEENPLKAGTRKKWGTMALKNISVRLPEGFQPLLNISGALNYRGENFTFQDVQAFYGNSPFLLKGTVDEDPAGGLSRFHFAAHAPEFKGQDLSNISNLKQFNFKGPATVKLVFDGTAEDYAFDSQFDLTKTTYNYKEYMVKSSEVSNHIRLQGRIAKDQPVRFNNFLYQLGENEINGRGTLKSFDDPEISFELASKNFPTRLLARTVSLFGRTREGRVDFSMKGQGHLGRMNEIKYQGNSRLKHLVFDMENQPHPLTLNGDVKFNRSRFEFNRLDLRSGASRVNLSGLFVPGPRPTLNMNVQGPRLALEDFVQSKGDGELGQGLRDAVDRSALLSLGVTHVDFNVNHFQYKFLDLNRVSGRLSFKDKKLNIEQMNVHSPEARQIVWQGSLSLQDPKVLQVDTYMSAKNVLAKDLTGLAGRRLEGGLSGHVKSFESVLKSRGNSMDQIKRSLEGRVAFELKDGTLHQERLMQGLRSITGTPEPPASQSTEDSDKPKRSPYQLIAGDFSIRQGVAKTNNFRFDSEGKSTSMVGWFDLNRKEMDTVVGVAPLANLDKFLVKIPLFGRIITAGDEGSLLKAYFTVDGPFDDPQVNAIPFTSLEKKLVGTFQGLLTTPQELLTPLEPLFD